VKEGRNSSQTLMKINKPEACGEEKIKERDVQEKLMRKKKKRPRRNIQKEIPGEVEMNQNHMMERR
jgi:hypothetical protein